MLTTRLLEKLELARPGFLAKFDLITGASTGAISALGLAAGITPAVLSTVYQEKGRLVFADSWLDNILDGIVAWGAQYSNEGLKQILQDLFGGKTLGDLPKKVLIPTVDLDNKSQDPRLPRQWKAKFFHNYPGDGSDAAQRVVDVALRSMSAPVFFPIYQGYIDGGLAANNPSMCALVQALGESDEAQTLDDIVLLSVGTGRNPKFIPELDADWGLVQWAYRRRTPEQPPLRVPLVELMFEVNIGLADYQCRQLLGASYHRLDPILREPIDLDDNSQISQLNRLAGRKENLEKTITWLKQYC